MDAKELQQATSKIPFLLELTDGRVYLIDKPDNWIVVDGGRRLVAVFKGGSDYRGDFFIDEPADKIKRVYQPSPSVTFDRFVDAIRHQPFRPFRLHMAGGWHVRIDAPEFASIDRRGETIRFQELDGKEHVIDTLHVTGIVLDADSHDEGKRSASFQQAIGRVNREPDASD